MQDQPWLFEPITDKRIKIFQTRLLTWFAENGRHYLPWKYNQQHSVEDNLYRIWLSEIMLQQTQVISVISYFERFTATFPTLKQLALGSLDEVLALWAGLGYYSRARNLHACAKQLYFEHQGKWPITIDEMIQLKGIGRTTAAAILSQGLNLPLAIVDGNVKRVLSRFLGCYAPANQLEKVITPFAQCLVPEKKGADYTQAIMDLGAKLCVKKPKCDQCFLTSHCYAFKHQKIAELPVTKPKKEKPTKHALFFIIHWKQSIYLTKRDEKGIWGGLWSLPEYDLEEMETNNLDNIVTHSFILDHLATLLKDSQLNIDFNHFKLNPFKHTFSHYHLLIYPVVIELTVFETKNKKIFTHFFNQCSINEKGLPKPVSKLIKQVFHSKADLLSSSK